MIKNPQTVSFTLNGERKTFITEPNEKLLDLLRREGYKGTKFGCGQGTCGACTVLVDDRPRLACSTLAHQVAGRKVETVESLSTHGTLSRLQAAFHEKLGTQCGFCTPGMLMASEALLRKNPDPSREDIKTALAGNLCRCTGYVKIIESVEAAAAAQRCAEEAK